MKLREKERGIKRCSLIFFAFIGGNKMKIVLDAMGGDNAPDANIKGAINAINQVKAEVILVGKEEVIRKKNKRILWERNRRNL